MKIYARLILAATLSFSFAASASADLPVPHIGYVYPAGGKQGTVIEVTLGGRKLDDVANVYFSGEGVQAEILEITKPLTQRRVEELREKAQDLRKKLKDADSLKELTEIEKALAISRYKQSNPSLGEGIVLKVKIAANAAPGLRELRIATAAGLSNPMAFQIGQLTEYARPEAQRSGEFLTSTLPEPARKALKDRKLVEGVSSETSITLPAVVNGQVMPSESDCYRFHAKRGQQIVVAADVRDLIPYLADAVPGWFQAVVSICDADGNELAYADHYRFDPDPVLCYKIPKDGQYVMKIRDALYRGREDFVYRVAVGELPFVTSAFPLGGAVDTTTAVELKGWNLTTKRLDVDAKGLEPGVIPLTSDKKVRFFNRIPFSIDALPEVIEKEPNDEAAKSQTVTTPVIVNGRIDSRGDWDAYKFAGKKGGKIVIEVDARKLDSPLDSIVRLTDSSGKLLAMNDDFGDKETGMITHHADSYISVTLPEDGDYYAFVGDAQRNGGPEYAYRLRISEPAPDFALRVTPSGINVPPGGSASFVVYVLRKDGFSGSVDVILKESPKGYKISGGVIPAGADKATLTLSAPRIAGETALVGLSLANEPEKKTSEEKSGDAKTKSGKENEDVLLPTVKTTVGNIRIQGEATVEGKKVVRPAVPAEDMMQAFIYHHLVAEKNLLVAVPQRGARLPAMKRQGESPLKFAPGETAIAVFSFPAKATLNSLQFELREGPLGMSLQDVAVNEGKLTIRLRTDASKIKAGLKGNLIIEIFAERSPTLDKEKKSANVKRISLGTLPAVPYEVVESEKQEAKK